MTGSRARAAPRAGPGSVTGTAPRAPTGSGRSWGKSLPLRSGESPECMGRAPLPPGSCGSRTGAAPYYCAPSPSTTRLSIVQRAFLVEVAGNRRLLPGLAAVGCRRGGAGGAPGTTRGGQLSKSVAKAPRTGIGREKKRGISTILFRRFGSIRAFVADLDNLHHRGPLREGGRGPREGRRKSGGGRDGHPDRPVGPAEASAGSASSRLAQRPRDPGAGHGRRGPRRRSRPGTSPVIRREGLSIGAGSGRVAHSTGTRCRRIREIMRKRLGVQRC